MESLKTVCGTEVRGGAKTPLVGCCSNSCTTHEGD
eukprot:COSAG06_NODE_36136_length_451_cov_0.869318_2_plen_34_part_01